MIIRVILSRSIADSVIFEADDAFNAMDVLLQEEIDAVILDIMMPGKNGLELLQEMKDHPSFTNIPVIMWTAVNEEKSLEKALQIGALDYFTKPLTEEQIMITLPLKVRNALMVHQQRMELLQYNQNMKYEMQLAEQLQKSLISEKESYSVAGMWGRFIPCDEIGGDMYCCKQTDNGNKLWFMIADVVGHGIAAAMVSTMLKMIFNTCVEYCRTPKDLMNKINSSMVEAFEGSIHGFASCFIGFIEGNKLFYTNAGHPYPIHFSKGSSRFMELKFSGLQLGMFEDAVYEDEGIDMKSGDLILMYTDGLFDKGKDHGFSQWNEVLDFCNANSEEVPHNTEEFLDLLIEHFSSNGDRSFIDDVAIMALRHN